MQHDDAFKQTDDDGDSGIQNVAFEGLTRLNDDNEVANFLTYGKWNLKDADIEHLMLEEERKERVGGLKMFAHWELANLNWKYLQAEIPMLDLNILGSISYS